MAMDSRIFCQVQEDVSGVLYTTDRGYIDEFFDVNKCDNALNGVIIDAPQGDTFVFMGPARRQVKGSAIFYDQVKAMPEVHNSPSLNVLLSGAVEGDLSCVYVPGNDQGALRLLGYASKIFMDAGVRVYVL